MRMSGLPAALVAGRPYTVALEPTGAGELGDGRATISVFDRTGRGWSATYQSARGLRQEFTVGLHGSPYRVSVTYPEPTCERTLVRDAAGDPARLRRRRLRPARARAARRGPALPR